MNLIVIKDIPYRSFVSYLPTLKSDYKRVLASFSLYEHKEKNIFIRDFKKQIYSLKYTTKKKDKIWEYLNDDISFEVLNS